MKRSILLSLMVIGAVAALITAATSATFSDEVTSNGNTLATGTLLLSIDNHCGVGDGTSPRTTGGSACSVGVPLTITNVKPGDTNSHTFNIINDGSIAGGLVVDVTTSGGGSCDEASGNWTITPDVTSAVPLAAAGSTSFTLDVTLKSTAGNACQNVTLTVNVKFTLTQS